MYASRFNLIVPVEGTDEKALINHLSGSLDFVNEDELEVLRLVSTDTPVPPEKAPVLQALKERGYVYDSRQEEESELYRALIHHENRMARVYETFLMVVTYACNMACAYCFQEGVIARDPDVMSIEMVDQAFKVMDRIRESRGQRRLPVVSLFGGEPFLPDKRVQAAVEHSLQLAMERGWHREAITNGVNLAAYTPMLARYGLREAQVTLDGPRDVHDKRRPLAGGGPSFDKICRGIDMALASGIKVNIRTVVDADNWQRYHELIELFMKKGWTDTNLFRVHIGQAAFAGEDSIFHPDYTPALPHADVMRVMFQIFRKHPFVESLVQFKALGFDHLFKTGRLYPSAFSACPGLNGEYAFDPHGYIYGCVSTLNTPERAAGRYAPQFEVYPLWQKWQERRTVTVQGCRTCKYSLVCAGSCPIVPLVRLGTLDGPSCWDVEASLREVVSYYYPRLKELANRNQTVAVAK